MIFLVLRCFVWVKQKPYYQIKKRNDYNILALFLSFWLWIPAFAGMTMEKVKRGEKRGRPYLERGDALTLLPL
jgi:hypothetical protein